MEPLSQALLGAAVAQVVAGRSLGPRAAGWGALVGMAPDIDVVAAGLREGYGELLYHRGSTHSLWFGPVVGPILGWLLWRGRGAGTSLAAWRRLAVWALLTHPLLDVFTPYGTQLFAPFSRARFAWHGVGIIDPFYTLPLLLFVAISIVAAPRSQLAFRSAAIGLVVTTTYLVVGVGLNGLAERDARQVLEAAGAPALEVRVYPTMLQPFLRRVVSRGDGESFVGWHTSLRLGCVHGSSFAEPDSQDPRIADLAGTWQGQLFHWFAMEETTAHIDPEEDGTSWVSLDDLRYGGFGSPPSRSMWGVRARYDPAGERIGPVVRFRRGFDERSGFGPLLEGTFGNFAGQEADTRTRCDPVRAGG
jgi:inner membrane protein